MRTPILLDIASFVLGYLFSYYVTNCFRKFTKKYDIGLARLVSPLPVTIGGIIIGILVLPSAVCVISNFVWGKIALDFLYENNTRGVLEAFLINIFCCFYLAVITKNMDT